MVLIIRALKIPMALIQSWV